MFQSRATQGQVVRRIATVLAVAAALPFASLVDGAAMSDGAVMPDGVTMSSAAPPMCGTSVGSAPHITKVLWIAMENTSYGSAPSQIPGSPSASYIDNTMLAQCGSTSNYHGVTHPSYPNYIAMTSGSTQGSSTDHMQYFPVASIFSQVDPSWRSYQEYMPQGCDHYYQRGDATTHHYYAGRHNPAASYSALPVGAPTAGDCPTYDEPLGTTTSGALIQDVQGGNLPRYSFVTPGFCNDMHLLPSGDNACPDAIKGGDNWLATWIPILTSGPDYTSGNLLIDVVWDEGRGASPPAGGDCTVVSDPGCIVPNIVISPYTPHTVSATNFSHYSLLKTTERLLGVPYLGHAADVATNDMCGDFGLCPTSTNQPPSAVISASCAGSTCSFDGTGSADPDGTIAGYAWTFGDGSTGTGPTVSHSYASGGTFTVGLTVTDNQGARGSSTATVTPTGPPAPGVTFKAIADVNANSASPTVKIPSATAPGDRLLLFLSVNANITNAGTPGPGWTLVGTRQPVGMASMVWQKTAAAGDAGSNVTVSLGGTSYRADMTVADYGGVTAAGVRGFATSDDKATSTHVTPSLATVPGDWVVSYWADKSPSTTSWTAPAGQTVESTSIGPLSAGRVTSLITDYGSTPIGSSVGSLVATTNAASSKSTEWTIALAAS